MQFISMSTNSDLHYLQPSVDYYDVKKNKPYLLDIKIISQFSALKNNRVFMMYCSKLIKIGICKTFNINV